MGNSLWGNDLNEQLAKAAIFQWAMNFIFILAKD
jgi:hypothetical protein